MEVLRNLDLSQIRQWLLIVWMVVAGPLMVAVLPIKALDPLRRFLLPFLRRGKLLQSSDSARRGLLSFTVPQGFFTHFYILGLALNTVFLFIAFGFACKCSDEGKQQFSSVVAQLTGAGATQAMFGGDSVPVLGKFGREAWRLNFLLLLMEIHLIRRLYECLFISTFQPSARMNFFGYLVGLGYYVLVPATLFTQSFSHESYANAFKLYAAKKLQHKGEEILSSTGDVSDAWDLVSYLGNIGWRPFIGAGLCFYGAYHQHVCHKILASLRAADEPGSDKKYYVPKGDWFDLVSSPHYLAEIVMYAGLVVASGGTQPVMYLMLGFVVANLYLCAKPTHEWYLSKFDDYPRSRRALFPFVD